LKADEALLDRRCRENVIRWTVLLFGREMGVNGPTGTNC
jgi:hypothetical protein